VQKDRFVVEKYKVKQILLFVDETLLRIEDGHDFWLWTAYEHNLDRCLMIHLSRERTIFVYYRFFRQLRNRLTENPYSQVVLDGTAMLDCKWLGLKHRVYGNGFEPDGKILFVQQIKDRTTECFDDHFPCRKQNRDIQHV